MSLCCMKKESTVKICARFVWSHQNECYFLPFVCLICFLLLLLVAYIYISLLSTLEQTDCIVVVCDSE